ncbi:MAG: hypothetical protein ACKV1O_13990 [Saprospiraceae bacterium]
MNLIIFQWWPPVVRPDHKMDAYWDDMIHKDDLAVVYSTKLKTNIFQLTGQEGAYFIIQQSEITLRVKSACLKNILYEGFYLGDKVQVIENNNKNTPKTGTISTLFYHFKSSRLCYHLLDEKGKRLKKQYFSDDFEKLDG